MYDLWKLIVVLLLATVGLSSAVKIEFGSSKSEVEQLVLGWNKSVATVEIDAPLHGEPSEPSPPKIVKRDAANGEASTSFWGWLTGRENPDPCMMASVGGVVGGGALTGAFVGAGIGSVFTGPGTVIGAVVGGVAGLFGGVSIGHRAGAAVCDKSCGDVDQRVMCYDSE